MTASHVPYDWAPDPLCATGDPVGLARAHIADYMAEVGASSRFQAGVIAARSGHIDTTR